MSFDLRLVAYNPNGAKLGILHYPLTIATSCPLNDVSGLQFSYTRGAEGSEWLEDFVEVGVEWNSGDGEWTEHRNGRFIKMQWDGDRLDETQTLNLTMPGYGWLLQTAQVEASGGSLDENGRRQFITATPGEIIRTLVLEAQARGALPGMAMDISNASDSDGEPWAGELTIALDVGMGLDQVLTSLADQGIIDWEFWGRELHVYNANTLLARDLTVGVNPVKLQLDDIQAAPDRGDASGLIHRALLKGEDGLLVAVNNPTAPAPWGKFEATIEQGGVEDEGMAQLLIQKQLEEASREKVEMTRTLEFGVGRWLPFRDYRIGDYILAPGRDGVSTSVRVRQLTFQRDAAGVVTGNAVLNDRFVERSLKAAKKARAIAAGAVVGSGGSGTRPAPPGPDERTPAAPAGLVVEPSAYVDRHGNPQGLIEAAWAPVTTATNGSTMDIARYELWGRLNIFGEEWRLEAGSIGTYAAASPFDAGTEWSFRVRAIGLRSSVPGAWSSEVVVEIPDDEEPPPAPSLPVLTTRLGTVRAAWDGETFEGAAMPIDLDYVEVHAGAPGFTPTAGTHVDTLRGSISFTVLTDLPYNTDVGVRLVAVDRSGNRSDPSAEAVIEVLPLVDTDLIGEIISGANIVDGSITASDKIVANSITGGLIQALAISAGKIAANAITADKIAAGAITTEKLSIGSVAPTHLAGAGVNRVTDPGFEDTAYWTEVFSGDTAIQPAVGSWLSSTATARSGGRSGQCQISVSGTTSSLFAWVTPVIPAPASRRLYVASWYRLGGGAGAPAAGTRMYVSVRVENADGSAAFQSLALPTPTSVWKFAETTLAMPSTAVSYQARIYTENHGGLGSVYFDDVIVQDAIGTDDSSRVQIDPSGMRVYSGSTERIRLDANGLEAFNNAGEKTVDIDSATGKATISGTFRTGWEEPFVNIAESALESPTIYFHPIGASSLYERGNVLGWFNGSDVPAVHLNAGRISSTHVVQQVRVASNGDWAIGSASRTATLTAASADSDGTWWMGAARTGIGTAVSGAANGSWYLGASRTVNLPAAHGDTDNWWLGYATDVNSPAVHGSRDGAWWLGPTFANAATARVFSDASANWGIGTNGGSRIHGYAGTSGDLNLNCGPSGGTVWAIGGNFSVSGGSKLFHMEHPSKLGHALQHAATESPVSGIEYWGEVTLDAAGRAVIELPDYFEALAKERNRAVLVTGRNGAVDWTDVEGNSFTVTGAPGQRAAWLVKAERHSADFEVEPYWNAPGPVPGFDLPPDSPELLIDNPTPPTFTEPTEPATPVNNEPQED